MSNDFIRKGQILSAGALSVAAAAAAYSATPQRADGESHQRRGPLVEADIVCHAGVAV